MSDTLKSIEELKAELAAAEQKLYLEKQTLLEEERKAKREAERIEREAAEAKAMLGWEKVAKEIVKALVAVGFTKASYDMAGGGMYPTIKCFPNDFWAKWDVRFESTYARSYSGTETKVLVGQYGETSRYPRLKTGGFNYDKIAKTAWEKYEAAVATQKRESEKLTAQQSNEARIKRLVGKFGVKPYASADYRTIDNVKVSHYTYHNRGNNRGGDYSYRSDNSLIFTVDSITEENAAKLLEFMVANGMIKTEEK